MLVLLIAALLMASAAAGPSKSAATPVFWQADPQAGFEGDGSEYCAPTSLSDGLIYLASARGLSGLVKGTGYRDQVGLIKELAKKMQTDPEIGTNPDRIVSGLRQYVAARGYRFARLEVKGWRGLAGDNKRFWTSKKPDVAWLRAAAADPACVVLLNVGWYREEDDGYSRHGGHWVTVVGTGAGDADFHVHNPILKPDVQRVRTLVKLSGLTDDFEVVKSGSANGSMKGYYQVSGSGLPYGKRTAAAVLDSAIVFSLVK